MTGEVEETTGEEMDFVTDFDVGPSAIAAYSRLNYTMWYALAEFIDNSTQSRKNYDSIIDDVLEQEGSPLVVEISYSRLKKEIRIKDNSIGMSKGDLIAALRLAQPTTDSRGRSKYGLGLKTAACWIGKRWKVITSEFSDEYEYTADVDVASVSSGGKIPIKAVKVERGAHYTEIVITDLNRSIQGRTEENIRHYLGSMYRFDLREGRLKLLYNEEPVLAPDDHVFDTDEHGRPYRRELPPFDINGHPVVGWVGVLSRGAGGRKYGGFSLFQHKRQIQGFPNAWKPSSIFGGVDDEGANNLISQRLVGVLEMDGFEVSHTKDTILFRDGEQETLEQFLIEQTQDFRDYASRRRGEKGKAWTREKVKELIEGLRPEFTNDEIKDAAEDMLPPLDAILENNRKQITALREDEEVIDIEVVPGLRVIVSLQERSEYDPYLTISAGAEAGVIHVIINNLHPYYAGIESPDANEECLRQYIYDAIAEYQVSKQFGRVNPDSSRKKKDTLLRAKAIRVSNSNRDAGEAGDDRGPNSV